MPVLSEAENNSFKRLFYVASAVLIFDQLSKYLIEQWVPFGISYFEPDRIPVIDNFFYIVHIGNEGAAWGLFSEYKGMLTILAFVVLALIYCFKNQLELKYKSVQVAFGLLIGGIIGNLIDRIRLGYVIDFIDIHLPFQIPFIIPYGRWPAFNVADSCIVMGLFSYLILNHLLSKRAISNGQ